MASDVAVDPAPSQRHLETQLAVSRLIAEAHAPDDVLCPLLRTLCEGLRWNVGELWLVEVDQQRLYRAAVWHDPEHTAPQPAAASVGRAFRRQEGVPGRVWASGSPLWITDIAGDDNFPRGRAAVRDGLHGCYAFPAPAAGEVVGVLQFFSRELRPPGRSLRVLMESVGALVGGLVHRGRQEAVARAHEREHRGILESSPDAIVVVNARGRIVRINQETERLFGYDRASLLGQPVERLIPSRLRDAHAGHRTGYFQTPYVRVMGTALDLLALRADGSEFPVQIRLSHLDGPEGSLALAAIRDVTAQARTEAWRVGQNRILERIATGLPLDETLVELVRLVESQSPLMLGSILLLDPDGVHMRHGAAPSLPPSYIASGDGAAIGPAAGSCGTAMYRRELVVVTDIQNDPLWADCRHLAAPHGLRACWSKPILSPQGEVLGSFAMYYRETRCPTEDDLRLIDAASHLAGIAIQHLRAQSALLESESRLQQAQKMEAVGQLAGGVAHDFNNLLNVIMGYCSLLLKDTGFPGASRGRLEEIQKAVDRAASLTRQLLAFSRKQVLEPRIVDLNHVVRDVEQMLRRLIGENIQLTTALADDLGRARVDPGQMEQVIVNLAVNARDAMPDGGTLVLETANVTLAPPPGAPRVDQVMLAVRDTGCGMDAEVLSHVFEPFFTTKEVGKGTGLGLATVYGIVQQSGGTIDAASEPGVGSVFRVYLPRVELPPETKSTTEATRDPEPRPPEPGGAETILLVEDDRALRVVVHEFLADAGYNVLESSTPEEAVTLGQSHAGPVHLLLTDLVMPHLSGRAIAERLKPLRPRMKVLYMSGYADNMIPELEALGADAFIAKPFAPEALLRRVREVLGRSEGRSPEAAPR